MGENLTSDEPAQLSGPTQQQQQQKPAVQKQSETGIITLSDGPLSSGVVRNRWAACAFVYICPTIHLITSKALLGL